MQKAVEERQSMNKEIKRLKLAVNLCIVITLVSSGLAGYALLTRDSKTYIQKIHQLEVKKEAQPKEKNRFKESDWVQSI